LFFPASEVRFWLRACVWAFRERIPNTGMRESSGTMQPAGKAWEKAGTMQGQHERDGKPGNYGPEDFVSLC